MFAFIKMYLFVAACSFDKDYKVMSGGAACPVRLLVNKTACPCPLDESEIRWEKLYPCPVWSCYPQQLVSINHAAEEFGSLLVEEETIGDLKSGIRGIDADGHAMGSTLSFMWLWTSLATVCLSFGLFLVFHFFIKPIIVGVP